MLGSPAGSSSASRQPPIRSLRREPRPLRSRRALDPCRARAPRAIPRRIRGNRRCAGASSVCYPVKGRASSQRRADNAALVSATNVVYFGSSKSASMSARTCSIVKGGRRENTGDACWCCEGARSNSARAGMSARSARRTVMPSLRVGKNSRHTGSRTACTCCLPKPRLNQASSTCGSVVEPRQTDWFGLPPPNGPSDDAHDRARGPVLRQQRSDLLAR